MSAKVGFVGDTIAQETLNMIFVTPDVVSLSLNCNDTMDKSSKKSPITEMYINSTDASLGNIANEHTMQLIPQNFGYNQRSFSWPYSPPLNFISSNSHSASPILYSGLSHIPEHIGYHSPAIDVSGCQHEISISSFGTPMAMMSPISPMVTNFSNSTPTLSYRMQSNNTSNFLVEEFYSQTNVAQQFG
jgi:hypothetical protein